MQPAVSDHEMTSLHVNKIIRIGIDAVVQPMFRLLQVDRGYSELHPYSPWFDPYHGDVLAANLKIMDICRILNAQEVNPHLFYIPSKRLTYVSSEQLAVVAARESSLTPFKMYHD